MRPRPREVNIFNMSLLDILCGALGAFCFMMLVALPYYVAGSPDQEGMQKRTAILLKEMNDLREGMSDPEDAEKLRQLIEKLEAQIKQLEGKLNQYAYENQQLRAENERLTDENARLASENEQLRNENTVLQSEKNRLQNENDRLTAEKEQLRQENERLKSQVAMRRPFVIMAGAGDITQDVAIFVEDVMVSGLTDRAIMANAHFEPRSPAQGSGWENDITNFWVEQRGVTLWVSSTTPAQSSSLVFVKYRRPPPEGNVPFGDSHLRPTSVALTFYGDFAEDNRRSRVPLTPERFWVLAGTLNIDEKRKISFKEATEAERDEAWRTRMNEETRSPTPSPTPSPSLGGEDLDRVRKNVEEQRRRFEEERARRQQERGVSPAPTLSEEERARRERLLRERLSSPSPSQWP